MKPSEVLDAAATLIEPEGAWTQFQSAGTTPVFDEDDLPLADDGDPVKVGEWSAEARCWCAEGAIWRSTPEFTGTSEHCLRMRALDIAKQAVGGKLYAFNDAPNRTQAEVVSALRQAADLARKVGE